MKLGKGHQSRHMLLFAIALVVCFAWATTAFGAVGFGSPTPAVGAVVASPASFSIKAADANSELKIAVCNITIKDASSNTVVGLPASTVDAGVIKLDGAALAPGNYTAIANAVDPKLKVYSFVWAFSVGGGGSASFDFGGGFPVGTITDASAEVGATFTGPAPAAASVWVNGVEYAGIIGTDTISIAGGTATFVNGVNNVVVEVGLDTFSFSFVFKGAYDGPQCFECHPGIMENHAFSTASGCDPCHGVDSPFGGGYNAGDLSPHGDATGACISSGCHDGIASAANEAALVATCIGCHVDPETCHHSLAVEDAYCDKAGCHAIGAPTGSSTCDKCHWDLIVPHHAAPGAATMCADCHPSIIEQANPIRGTFTVTANGGKNLFKALMTHLKPGTGDPWLVNGNAATRKAECTDCHNIAATAVGDALAGVKGYKPNYLGKGNWADMSSAADFAEVTLGNTGEDSVYLCVKCHGGPASATGTTVTLDTTQASNTNTANTGDNRTYLRGDIAREFNPANASGHRIFPDADGVFRGEVKTKWFNVTTVPGNVVGKVGTNTAVAVVEPELRMSIYSLTTWFKGTDSNGNPWAYNSRMTCTDCHSALASNADATGPHGANIKYGLDPAYPREWKFATPANVMNRTAAQQVTDFAAGDQIICWKCHDLSVVYAQSNNQTHNRSNHSGQQCVKCHMAIPHGANRPRLLNDGDRDAAAYTGLQYGLALTAVNKNAASVLSMKSAAIMALTDSQLATTRFDWTCAAAGPNCTRGCNTHQSASGTVYFWE